MSIWDVRHDEGAVFRVGFQERRGMLLARIAPSALLPIDGERTLYGGNVEVGMVQNVDAKSWCASRA
jgi:hypothetical protein